ncbi:zinc finger protein OZF-like isoform X2 [Topomyia yanbarensis]|nr:zinc finger protein OZF-like isoform X2 [Topomyia yanbarensis]
MMELKQIVRFIRKARNSDRSLRKLFRSEIKQEAESDVKLNDNHFESAAGSETTNKSEVYVEEPTSLSVNNSDFEHDETNGQHLEGNDILAIDIEDTASNDEHSDEVEIETYQIVYIDKEQLLCCSCLIQFDDMKVLKTHAKEAHTINQQNSNKKFSCQHCNRRYSSDTAIRAHRRRMEKVTKVYQCRKCGVRVLDQHRRLQHARTHFKKCPLKPEKNPPTLEELMEKHGRLCCALGCMEFFETDEQLQAHAHSVHKANKVEATLAYNEGKPIECLVCFKRFKDDECLKRHLRFKYMPSKNICTLCGAKFPSLSSLTIHERSHTKEKPFQCGICSKGFGDKQSLKRHQVKHTNEKPFMCSVCGVSFKRKRAMQSHMIIHEPGQLPFKCEMCEKRFRVKAKMLYHMRTHTGERPYPCRHCDKSFADFSNRMRHELSHTGEKPYKCVHCSAGFITRRFMLEHEKIHKRNQMKQLETR